MFVKVLLGGNITSFVITFDLSIVQRFLRNLEITVHINEATYVPSLLIKKVSDERIPIKLLRVPEHLWIHYNLIPYSTQGTGDLLPSTRNRSSY